MKPKAPDEVFSGTPVLVHPQNGHAEFTADNTMTIPQFIEWHYLVSQGNHHSGFNIHLHGIPLNSSAVGKPFDLTELGMRYIIEVDKGMKKIVKVKLFLMATHPAIYDFTVTLKNSKGDGGCLLCLVSKMLIKNL